MLNKGSLCAHTRSGLPSPNEGQLVVWIVLTDQIGHHEINPWVASLGDQAAEMLPVVRPCRQTLRACYNHHGEAAQNDNDGVAQSLHQATLGPQNLARTDCDQPRVSIQHPPSSSWLGHGGDANTYNSPTGRLTLFCKECSMTNSSIVPSRRQRGSRDCQRTATASCGNVVSAWPRAAEA
jgi:hypothetical protein